MAKTRVVKSAGRFGPRYGGTVRARLREIELKQDAPHRCPVCNTRGKVVRISAGLWQCRKCGRRFAGGAYVPKTQIAVTQVRTPPASQTTT